jgi:hypothetical protein
VRWMDAIIVPAVLILGIFCFLVIAGFDKRMLAGNTNRAAERMDGNYADPSHQQQRRAGLTRQQELGTA